MRGTPFVQAILIVVVFLLAGIPTYRLTRSTVAAEITDKPATSDRSSAKSASLEVETMFAPAPADFQITNLGQPVLAGHGPQSRFAGRWTATVPPEGVDLVIEAHWPKSTSASVADPGAMRVTVRFPGGRTVEKTFWADADGALGDVFTVSGETAAATP